MPDDMPDDLPLSKESLSKEDHIPTPFLLMLSTLNQNPMRFKPFYLVGSLKWLRKNVIPLSTGKIVR
jgi:hypothetical protein